MGQLVLPQNELSQFNAFLKEAVYRLAQIYSNSVILASYNKNYLVESQITPIEWTPNQSNIRLTKKEILSLLFNEDLNISKDEKYYYLYVCAEDKNKKYIDFVIVSHSEERHDLQTSEIIQKIVDDLKSKFGYLDRADIMEINKLKDELINIENLLRAEKQISEALLSFTTTLANSIDLSSLLKSSLINLSSALGCEKSICFMLTENSNDVSFYEQYGLDELELSYLESNEMHELFSYAITSQEIVSLPHFRLKITSSNKPHSCLILPLVHNKNTIGLLVFLRKSKKLFKDNHIHFAQAVMGQLALAISQFRLVEETNRLLDESKKQASHNAALHRFTHELTSIQSLEEIFQASFKIINEELGIERLWIGLLNEPGTRIIGQSAFGTGWKRKIIEINIDISGHEHPLAEVIKTRTSKVLNEVDDILRGLGLRKFIEKHDIKSIVLVPLVSSGQILGVLAYESNQNDNVSLVQSFTSELASIILSRRLEQRINESETMRAAGLLAAGIAHNFNNLLQGILGQASLLELYSANPEQIVKSSKIISESASKGAKLVKQLLSFAYLEEPLIENFSVNELIERNKVAFQRQLKSKQFIRYNLKDNLKDGRGDPRQLIRIIMALLSNASEAMDDQGVVEIFSDNVLVTPSSPHYEVPLGNYVVIGVRDNGTGMDLETKRRCFEPFFTTKNIDPSSGLSLSGGGMGLAASYALAKKNGGRLVVDSRLGHGSLFTLYIKQNEVQAQENVKSSDDNKDELVKNIEILFQDEEKSINSINNSDVLNKNDKVRN